MTKKYMTPQIYNHGIIPVGANCYGEILKEFTEKFPKIILITAAHMINNMAKEIERFGIHVCRFVSSKSIDGRGTVLEEFNAVPAGTPVVLLTTPILASKRGWQVKADTIVLVGCFINLDYGAFDQMINRAEVKEVHLVNCIFTNRQIQDVWKMRDIRTVKSPLFNTNMLLTSHGVRSIAQIHGL